MSHLIERGEALFEEGDIDGARALFLEAIEIEAIQHEAFNNLGVIAFHQGDVVEALDFFTRALSANPLYAPALKNLAPIVEASGGLDQIADLIVVNAQNHVDDEELQLLAQKISGKSAIRPAKSGPVMSFLCVGEKFDHFVTDIAAGLSGSHTAQIIKSVDPEVYAEAIRASDVVWIEWANQAAVMATRVLEQIPNKRVLCRLHSYEVFTRDPQGIVWEQIDDLIFVSDHIKQLAEQNFPGCTTRARRSHVVPNGIDLSRFALNSRRPGKNVAFLGQVNFKKGPMLLLQAARALVESDPEVEIFIAGEFVQPRYAMYFVHHLKDYAHKDRIHLEGHVDDVPGWLKNMDFILCTSVLEGHPVGIMEAMACGLTPLIHAFYGAATLYPEAFLWRTVDELVQMVSTGPRPVAENRAFIEDGFQLDRQISAIREILEITA